MPTLLNIVGLKAEGAAPRYEQIADAVCQAIRTGQLKPGDRLPTVRRLANSLGVSLTTVTAAFRTLSDGGWTRGEIGRGTFVSDKRRIEGASAPLPANGLMSPRRMTTPWRRRSLMSLMDRLRSAYPNAADCSTGRPDPSMLPVKLIKRHWKSALDDITGQDLQYKTADPIEELAAILPRRLSSEGIPVCKQDLVVGTSAQQFITLTPAIVNRIGGREAVIAVEEPGYYTFFDTWDRAGVRMIGIKTDEDGALPESLESAIQDGANAVLLTPRAHNPTGASWTRERRRALGDVLSRHPQVIAIEDDHFGDIAEAQTGSLLSDSRVEDRVIYIRSFSKAIAPDLRLCIAAARPRIKSRLQEAKSEADGWSSRMLQRVLARVLQDEGLPAWLTRVRQTYRIRRERVAHALSNGGVSGVAVSAGRDGVNLWIHLPCGIDAGEVIERAAGLGVLVAPGEVFYLSPGHSDVVRFNAGSVETDRASTCAELLSEAIRQSGGVRSTAIHV